MNEQNRNNLNDVQDVALQVLQSELNNANARIIDLRTQLVMANKKIQELTPNENIPEENKEE